MKESHAITKSRKFHTEQCDTFNIYFWPVHPEERKLVFQPSIQFKQALNQGKFIMIQFYFPWINVNNALIQAP